MTQNVNQTGSAIQSGGSGGVAGSSATFPRSPTAQQDLPLWTDSSVLGGYFVYVPKTDEIYLRDGRHFPRPENLPRSALAIATYNGPLPPLLGLPRHPLPHADSLTSMPRMPAHLHPPSDISDGMKRLDLLRRPQHITGHRPVEVVFHQGATRSQIQRRDPPSLHARGIAIDKSELTSTLFKEYRVRPNHFFRLGRVFLVLWSEPAAGSSIVSKWASGTVINHLGERVFSRVRRFVVIREGGTYCNALPINTYTGRGVAKPGVNKSEHVIIFTGKNPPSPTAQEMPQRGELPLRTVPIQVDPDLSTEALDPMCRLDLGGVTRVEHNIKVKPFGVVNKRSIDALRAQYANVQNHQAGAGIYNTSIQYTHSPKPSQLAARSIDDDDEDDEDEEDEDDFDDDDDEDDEDEEDDDDDDDDDADDYNDDQKGSGEDLESRASTVKLGDASHDAPGGTVAANAKAKYPLTHEADGDGKGHDTETPRD